MSVMIGEADRTGPAPSEPPSERSRWVRYVLLGLGAFVVLWLLIAAVQLIQAKRNIDAGIARLEEARDQLSPGDLVRGEGRGAVEAAEREFGEARDQAGSLFVSPLKIVPLVGQQVRSVDAQTDAAAEVVTIGLSAVTDAELAFEQRPEAGEPRIALMDEVGRIAAGAQEQLQGVELGPDFFLVGPVGDAREKFAEKLKDMQASLSDSQAAAAGFAEFLRGPRRYLVLAANNAEMRAGSGMWLSAGVLTVGGGTFDLGEMRPTGDLLLPEGAVPVTGEFAE